ncbi:MAG: multidrug efflux MFS transporter [Candidatus Methanoplasma sp.]|nr:multidrug efflux MFS transporter [Candidatus Methanoplasma sp.]
MLSIKRKEDARSDIPSAKGQMPLWKRNLIVCWVGMFATGIGMSQIAPILPLYITELGVTGDGMINQLSGIAFGVTFVVAAIFSPIWGSAADKYGRKPMLLRASLGMAVVVALMGFAPNVTVLILLRVLLGTISGYITACNTLIATQVDKGNAGFALGTLATSNVAGSLLGPIIGGFIGDTFGLPPVFFITGSFMFIAFLLTLFFVKENFVPPEKKNEKMKEVWKVIPEKRLTAVLCVTFFVIMLGLYSIEPIITIYIKDMTVDLTHLALISGLAFSASGVGNVISASWLGKTSDRRGAHKVLLVSLITAGLFFIPQAFVHTPWELMGWRFLLGITLGGLTPAVITLVRKITPEAHVGRIFGFTMSAQYLGIFGGAVFGGQVSAAFGIPTVLLITGALMFIAAVWVYLFVFRRFHNKKEGLIADAV